MTGLTHEFSFTLPATQARAFAALTSADDLKVWFAEGVDIRPEPGGRFAFWGKHSYGTPAHPGNETTLSRYEPDKLIAFNWLLEERDSTVTLSLSPKPDSDSDSETDIKVVHTFAQAPAIGRARELVDDLWRLHIGALATHLQGKPVSLPDFADPHPAVALSIHVDAPRRAVWRTLTEPALLDKWLTKAATIDLEAGTLDFGWKYEVDGQQVVVPPMRLFEIEQDTRLVMEWRDWRGDPDVPHQRVEWRLSDAGAGTLVELVHDGFTRTADISDYPFGWVWFLDQLKGVAETATASAS